MERRKAFSSSYIRSLQRRVSAVGPVAGLIPGGPCGGRGESWPRSEPSRGSGLRGVRAKFPPPIDLPCQGLLSAVDRWLMNLSFSISRRIMGLCLGQEPRRAMISEPASWSPGEETRSGDVRKRINPPSPGPADSEIKGEICVQLVQLAPIKANN